jgi:hypothetical protein
MIMFGLLWVSIACFAWGAHDIQWSINHSSFSTMYTPGHPPPILKQVDDAFFYGDRMCLIGLAGAGSAAVGLFLVMGPLKPCPKAFGFEVIQ